jgi:5-formyltetrahydrofolate cyclo-ligase
MSNSVQQRQQARSARNALSSEQQKKHALLATHKILSSDFIKDKQQIALFLSQDGELSTEPLIHALWKMNKQVFLPKITFEKQLEFIEYLTTTKLKNNKYNIPEPQTNNGLIKTATLDLILMPLTAFDTNGNRIGMGGGYYDKTLQSIPSNNNPTLVGWAHQCQKVAKITPNPWDVKMNALITEKQIYRFSSS